MKIAVILGTRPEIIKMAPVIDKIKENDSECIIIHTGQHYDKEMSKQFFEDLKLPLPDYNIGVGSDTPVSQTSKMMEGLEEILIKESPDIVLVQGDTNAVLAGALSANKLSIPVGHVEAGLRSFDKTMPEELNRLVADECSMLYFVPTKETALNLLNEGINHKSIFITGNTIVDACKRNLNIAIKSSNIRDKIDFEKYIVLTMHRAENVDNKKRLTDLVNSIIKLPYNIVFPVHPHTQKLLKEMNLEDKLTNCDHIKITKPLGYLDFLHLLSDSSLILTDSGGIQEEAITLNIPCVTLRYNTERPETVSCGGNILVGTNFNEVTNNVTNILENKEIYDKMSSATNPYGNGTSAEQIYSIIYEKYSKEELNITSPTDILEFKGYKLKSIKEDITVTEFENKYDGIIIEQVFENEIPIYFEDNLNLNKKIIIIKSFEKIN